MKRTVMKHITFVDIVCPRCKKVIEFPARYGEYFYGFCCGSLLTYNVLNGLFSFVNYGSIIEIHKSKLQSWRDPKND